MVERREGYLPARVGYHCFVKNSRKNMKSGDELEDSNTTACSPFAVQKPPIHHTEAVSYLVYTTDETK